jgi:hypothetical protein
MALADREANDPATNGFDTSPPSRLVQIPRAACVPLSAARDLFG